MTPASDVSGVAADAVADASAITPVPAVLRGAVAESVARLAEKAAATGDVAFQADVVVITEGFKKADSELRRLRDERDRSVGRQRRNQAAIMALARSESLSRGALDFALREITETASAILNVERSSVWVYDGDETSILCLELFQRQNATHESGIQLAGETFPAYFEALKEERSIAAHNAHTDPRTAEFSASYLTPLGINSMLDAPIRVGGRMIGVICNEHVGPERRWTFEEEQFASMLADFIALAMESNQRHEKEAELRTMLQVYEDR